MVALLNYGVKGAAIATGISQLVTCSLLFFYLKYRSKFVKFRKIEKKDLKQAYLIFKLGFPEFITEISTGLLILMYNLIIFTKVGINGVSVFGLISYLTSFIVMTMIGFSQGLQPIISYNLGKKNYFNLKIIFKISILILLILGVLLFFTISYFSNDIAKIFFKEKNLIIKAESILYIYSFYYLILGINIFVASYFTAIKKIFYSVVITFSRGILLNALFLNFLPKYWGEKGIWISPFFSEIITLFLAFYFLFKIKN